MMNTGIEPVNHQGLRPSVSRHCASADLTTNRKYAMSSPKKSAAETKRLSVVSVRLTDTDKQLFHTEADKCGLSLSAFIRACALASFNEGNTPKRKRLSANEGRQIALILASLANLMDSIRDYEETPVQAQDQPLMLADLERQITTIRDGCFYALRRKP